MTEIVRQAGGVHDVGVAAERARQLTTDLSDLQAVGQPVPDEVVTAGGDHLGLGSEPSQRSTVQHPRTIARERGPAGPLDRLRHPPLRIMLVIPLRLLPHPPHLSFRHRLSLTSEEPWVMTQGSSDVRDQAQPPWIIDWKCQVPLILRSRSP